MSKKEFIITVIVIVLAIALIATVIVLKRANSEANGGADANAGTVAHDHNGDGVPDHGDEAHSTEGTTGGNVDAVNPEDSDVDISVNLEDIPAGESGSQSGTTQPTTGNNDATQPTTGNSGTTQPTTGSNTGTGTSGDNDTDVSIGIEEVTPGESGSQSGTTQPTTGSNTENNTESNTGSNTGSNDSTQPTEGKGNSGAVNGNEIDFDDLLNAGKTGN